MLHPLLDQRWQGREKARAAASFAREPLARWPMDTWLIREYVWAIYDDFLKANGTGGEDDEAPVESRPEFGVVVKAARRILKLSSEELPRTRAVCLFPASSEPRGAPPFLDMAAGGVDRLLLDLLGRGMSPRRMSCPRSPRPDQNPSKSGPAQVVAPSPAPIATNRHVAPAGRLLVLARALPTWEPDESRSRMVTWA
jgi:hypothetical protein